MPKQPEPASLRDHERQLWTNFVRHMSVKSPDAMLVWHYITPRPGDTLENIKQRATGESRKTTIAAFNFVHERFKGQCRLSRHHDGGVWNEISSGGYQKRKHLGSHCYG